MDATTPADAFAPPANPDQYDPIFRLPPKALHHVLSLKDRVSDAFAAARVYAKPVERLQLAALKAELELNEFDQNPPHDRPIRSIAVGADDGQPLPSYNAEHRKKLEARLEFTVAEHQRAARRQQELDDAAQAIGARLRRIERWLRDVPLTAEILDADPPALPKSMKGREAAAVAEIRDQIKALQAEAAKVAAALFPSATALSIIERQINVLAESGTPNCFRVLELAEPLQFPQRRIRSEVQALAQTQAGPATVVGAAFSTEPDALALVAWLFRGQLLAAIKKEIAEVADDRNALTPQQRADREAEILKRIDQLERQEAALVEIADLEHRADISVPAMLTVEVKESD